MADKQGPQSKLPDATLVNLKNREVTDLRDCNDELRTIGRSLESDVRIGSDLVSAQHAEIQWQKPFYVLRDNSKNGTYITFISGVEDTPTTIRCKPGVPYQLRHGDKIIIVSEPIGHFKVLL